MRRHLALLLTIPALAACDFQIFEPTSDWCFLGCAYGGSGTPTPSVRVSGQVWVGDYSAWEEEARVFLYAAEDTASPVDSIPVYGGSYWRDFGATPSAAVCGYMARAVLWSGASTAMEPLFPTTASCEPSVGSAAGPTFELPAYAALSEPFVLRGRVLVDGAPAPPAEVRLIVGLRFATRGAGAQPTSPPMVTPAADGTWSFEVTDGAQRYAFCRRADVGVEHLPTRRGDSVHRDRPSDGTCGNERMLPDARIGTRRAAFVQVLRGSAAGIPTPVGVGEGTVSLALPADSSVFGETFATGDDGMAHVWFPDDMTDPGCNFLLRVELDGAVQHHPLVPPGITGCREGYYRSFQFVGG